VRQREIETVRDRDRDREADRQRGSHRDKD
jgi:hypothetical protein